MGAAVVLHGEGMPTGATTVRALTRRQKDVVACIRQHLARHGYPPSTREIAESLEITPTAATGHIAACEKKGLLRRSPGIARGIRLLGPSGSGSRPGPSHASRTENAR